MQAPRTFAAGFLVWSALAVVAAAGRLDPAALLFLLAPLAVMPLAVRSAPLWAALPAAVSFFLPRGWPAAIAAAPWAFFTAVLALVALRKPSGLPQAIIQAGMLLLPVGGFHLLAHRAGWQPGGFPDEIVLLTAVHFHFTAFAGPVIVARTGARLRNAGAFFRILLPVSAAGILLGTPLLAAGFLLLPVVKPVAVAILVASFLMVAILEFRAIAAARTRAAKALLALSGLSILAGMALAAAFEIGLQTRAFWITIPQMVLSHGILNGLGFALCGLLAWELEPGAEPSPGSPFSSSGGARTIDSSE